jgi:hypothetical protein
VSVPNGAGAQHSQSPVKAENSPVMMDNETAAGKFRTCCVATARILVDKYLALVVAQIHGLELLSFLPANGAPQQQKPRRVDFPRDEAGALNSIDRNGQLSFARTDQAKCPIPGS